MSNINYVRSLDGTRAMAILLVMLFHFGILRFGWAGVPMFFVLSGYLITGILLKEKNGPLPLGLKFRQFWIRRVLRIFPLYYAYLGLFLLLFICTGYPADYVRQLPWLASYTYNFTAFNGMPYSPVFSHCWSLCIEEQFYLFFPFAVLLLTVTQLRRLCVMVLLGAPLFRFLFSLYLQQAGKSDTVVFEAVFWFPLSHADAFFTGAAIHLFRLHERIKRPHLLLAGILLITLAAGWWNYRINDHGLPWINSLGFFVRESGQWQQVWFTLCFNPLFGALLLVLVSVHDSPYRRLFRWIFETPAMVAIGRVSYGMYIYHWVIQEALITRIMPLAGPWKYPLFLLDFAIVYAVSLVSFHFFEQRFIAMKDRLAGTAVLLKHTSSL